MHPFLKNGKRPSPRTRKLLSSSADDSPITSQVAKAIDESRGQYADMDEVKRLAQLAAKATIALSPGGKGVESLNEETLRAYCEAKGVTIKSDGLAAAAKRYALLEGAARSRAGPVWDAHTPKTRIRLLHEVCNGEGDATYIDPETQCTVFAAVAHLRRGNCCGISQALGRTHRCRHCPYTKAGQLFDPSMRRLAARIPLIDAVRDAVTEQVGNLVDIPSSNESKSTQSNGFCAGDLITHSKNIADAGVGYTFEVDENAPRCGTCEGTSVTFCTRCKGFRFLVSPEPELCAQCEAKGIHPCTDCTPWRPPQRTHFSS